MAPKQRTKGQKEIEKDNRATVSFWQYVVGITSAIHASSVAIYWYFELVTLGTYLTFAFSSLTYLLCMWMLNKIAASGLDVTINQGTAGYTKDIMIVTIATQCLSIVSNYLMLLWMVVPGYGFYKLWVGLLWPWFKMGSEGGDTGNEKARKKQERKHGKRIIKYS